MAVKVKVTPSWMPGTNVSQQAIGWKMIDAVLMVLMQRLISVFPNRKVSYQMAFLLMDLITQVFWSLISR